MHGPMNIKSKLHFLTLCENFRNFLYVYLGVLYFDARRHEYQYQLLTALLHNSVFSVEVTHGLRVNRHVKMLEQSWITNNTRRWIFFALNCISFATSDFVWHRVHEALYYFVYPVKNFCCVKCRLSS